jgi:pimeloyl-ACP methyl ester carboxylesterase
MHGNTTLMETFTVQSGGITLRGVKTPRSADDAGVRSPLLFVHGYPDTRATWSPQLEAFGRARSVAAFDLPGVGESRGVVGRGRLRIEALLADLEAVIDAAWGAEARVHLIGHDWGGALALCFAGDPRRSGRLRSVVTIAGPHPALMMARLQAALRSGEAAELRFFAGQLRRSWYMLAFQIPGLAEALWRRWPEALWRRVHRGGGVPREDPELAATREVILSAGIGMLGLYRENFSVVRPRLPTISAPTCLIAPGRDFALMPALYDNLRAHTEALEAHYVEANHWAHREIPGVVNGIIEAFVRRVEDAGSVREDRS